MSGVPLTRKCYYLEFKRQALRSLSENGNNVSGTARQLGIDRKNLQGWTKGAGRLVGALALRSINSRNKKRVR